MSTEITPRELVALLGGHVMREARIDPEDAAGLGSWLIFCSLLSAGREGAALAGWQGLAAAGLASPAALAAVDPSRAELALGDAPLRDLPGIAARSCRCAGALVELGDGGLPGLLDEALDLDEAGERIVRLAPGVGRGAALRFLRALRGRRGFEATPPARSALAAAIHLGWLAEGCEAEEAGPALLRALAPDGDTALLVDGEAALERLGSRACVRGHSARCPLAERCPARDR